MRTKQDLLKFLNSVPVVQQQQPTGPKLTPEEVAYHLERFQAKKYTDRTTVPMSPRQIAELERQNQNK